MVMTALVMDSNRDEIRYVDEDGDEDDDGQMNK